MEPVLDPFCSLTEYLKTLGIEDQGIAGIPQWMAYSGMIVVLLVSHISAFPRAVSSVSAKAPQRFNLLHLPGVGALVRFKGFPLLMQFIPLGLFLLILTAGLFAPPKNNIAPVLTWTWWWALLIFVIMLFGKGFCMVCPWEALSSMVSSWSLSSRVKRLTYGWQWPRWARNVYPAAFLFLILTWFELGRNVTHSPLGTALMALTMAAGAILVALIFERRAFCRYVCLVGRISGLYALFSPVELRPESKDACLTCADKPCYHGNDQFSGCPTHLFPGNLKENTYCTLCTECIRACPKDNLALRLRPFAADLFTKDRFQWDEAMLAVILLALTSFHGLTMTPLWYELNNALRVWSGWGGTPIFTILMILMLIAPMMLFWVCSKISVGFTPGAGVSAGKVFKVFAYSLLPIALFYHVAHNSMHFFLEAGGLLPLLSDPLGRGWDLFGTAGKVYGPLLSLSTIWWIQIVCIVIGHVYGVLVADRLAKRLFEKPGHAMRALIPLLAAMVLYSCFSIWLIAQPMDMRTSSM